MGGEGNDMRVDGTEKSLVRRGVQDAVTGTAVMLLIVQVQISMQFNTQGIGDVLRHYEGLIV